MPLRTAARLHGGTRMRRLLCFLSLSFSAVAAEAQWRPFFEGALFATHASQAGPQNPESRTFSTNWLAAGAERTVGRATFLAGARISLEPMTIPREGYPQLLQYVSAESGGPLVDRMRPQDLVQEIAFATEWRALRLYLAPVGEPPLGAEPYAERSSSVDFAEAPFAYDVQESFHVATRVVSLGLASKAVAIEGGVFHDSHSTGRHTTIDDGDIDSWSARVTIAPQSRFSAQISAGELGDDKREVNSASISYDGGAVAVTGLWTKRDTQHAYGIETALRPGRSTVLARAEWVDRPAGIFTATERKMAHVTLGYILDVVKNDRYRAGVGINVDYHSSTKTLVRNYGHKPQGIYAFVRVRTNRRASV